MVTTEITTDFENPDHPEIPAWAVTVRNNIMAASDRVDDYSVENTVTFSSPTVETDYKYQQVKDEAGAMTEQIVEV